MIAIVGAGWIAQTAYGCLLKELYCYYAGIRRLHSQLRREPVFISPLKNFGRFDVNSKMACAAAGLALHDAGISYSPEHKQDMAILGTNTNGSLKANLAYFKDYLEAGRRMARGNLFTFTLSSSPLAEIAISFGLRGPLAYFGFPEKRLSCLLRYAEGMLRRKETVKVLAMQIEERESICFVLSNKSGSKKICSIEKTIAITEKASSLEKIVKELRKTIEDKANLP